MIVSDRAFRRFVFVWLVLCAAGVALDIDHLWGGRVAHYNPLVLVLYCVCWGAAAATFMDGWLMEDKEAAKIVEIWLLLKKIVKNPPH